MLLFEMLASYPPFYDEDPMKIYVAIMNGVGRVKFPSYLSGEAVSAVKAFLCSDVAEREANVAEIRKHAWFADFDWLKLRRKEMAAPIVPEIKSERDRSNFERVHSKQDQDELEMERREKEEAESYVDDGSGWDLHF